MADPVTVIQVISASTSLVAQCAKAIKGLHDLAGKYKNAEISIRSTAHELDIIRIAWERIESALRSWDGNEDSEDELLQRLRQNLEFGALIVASLAEDMSTFTKRPFTFTQRSKYVWSENKFKEHQDRIRGQVSAMNLLVSVMKMPSAPERLSILHEGAEVLRKSDESAFTIVPSHMSSRLPSIYSNSSKISIESAELVYRQLNVDNDLFTARVYKRNYRHPSMNFLMKTRSSTSVQMRDRPSTGIVATDTLDSQIQRASPENQSMISLDYEEENTSQPPHGTRATLLKTFDGVQIPSSSWVTGLPISTTRKNTIIGPAVSTDLVYVYMDRDPEQSRNLADSVSKCQPDHLVHLLRLLAGIYPTWKKRYLGEACNQNKVDLVQLLVDDGTLRKWIIPRKLRRSDDSSQSNHLNDVASQLLLTEVGKNALTGAVTRVQHDYAYSEDKRREAQRLLPYELPAAHALLLAAERRRDFDSIDVLLKDGVDVNAKFEDGKTCLHRMASMASQMTVSSPLSPSGHLSARKVIKLLLHLGADIEATTHNGDNFLHLEAQSENPLSSYNWQSLLPDNRKTMRFSSALSAVNQEGNTPGMVAEQFGNEEFLAFVEDLNQMNVLGLMSPEHPGLSKLKEQKGETIIE